MLLTLCLLLLLSAFFSGSETALMALNRYRLRHLANQGHRGAKLAQKLLEKPDRLIGLILLGNNVVNVAAAQLAGYIGYTLYGGIGVPISAFLFTLAVLIFAEVTPKTLAALHSEKIAFPAAVIYTPLLIISYPFVYLINLMSNSLLRLFGVSLTSDSLTALSHEELRTVVNEAGGLIPQEHQNMLISILDLERITVEDIMIPRSDVIGIDLDDDWDEVVQQIQNAAFTRLPVYRESIDNVVGFIHLRKVLPLLLRGELNLELLQQGMREAYFIPEGTSLNQQLLNFQKNKRRFALIVDEYGDIQGLVTLEDLLEEIVGEFTTDPSTLHVDVHPQEDGSYVVDASAHVREINRALRWKLHDDGPRTINGLILEHMETIPEPGTTVLIDGYPIEVVHTINNVVRTVRMKPRVASYTQ